MAYGFVEAYAELRHHHLRIKNIFRTPQGDYIHFIFSECFSFQTLTLKYLIFQIQTLQTTNPQILSYQKPAVALYPLQLQYI